MVCPLLRFGLLICVVLAMDLPAHAQIDEFEREPINYRTAKLDNAIVVLHQRIDTGKSALQCVDDHGYLPAVLKELDIPLSSQVLVFSKTSLQRDRITPKTPRAIYFNDDVYVGFCLRGDVLEISAADTSVGTAFYTLDQEFRERPRLTRQTDSCLTCHASPSTGAIPGHLLRSVFTDRMGQPILSAGGFRTNPTSPFSERYGGWYVTGTHGKQKHMGNWIVQNERDPFSERNDAGQNVTELKSRFTVGNYLTPHSDLVALLVLEHQVDCHNRLVQAMITTRQARHYEFSLNKDLGEPLDRRWDSATRRIAGVADRLVESLLFSKEAKLDGAIAGTSEFAREFVARGPSDKKGRSLRQFDLKTRLFRYPCSYLIYSKSFAALPADVKEMTLKRLHEVLTGKDQSEAFAHLSAEDRKAILEILRDTLPNLPESWKV